MNPQIWQAQLEQAGGELLLALPLALVPVAILAAWGLVSELFRDLL